MILSNDPRYKLGLELLTQYSERVVEPHRRRDHEHENQLQLEDWLVERQCVASGELVHTLKKFHPQAIAEILDLIELD